MAILLFGLAVAGMHLPKVWLMPFWDWRLIDWHRSIKEMNGSEIRIVQDVSCHPKVRSAAEGTMKRDFIERIVK